MQLFLPEEGLLQAEAAVHVHLKPGGEPQQLALRPGLNSWDLQWEGEPTPWLVLSIDSQPPVKPANSQDQRQLLAVPNDLSAVAIARASRESISRY
jgi:hypothetical protein